MALKHASMMWNPSYMLVHLGPFHSFELLQIPLGLQIFKKKCTYNFVHFYFHFIYVVNISPSHYISFRKHVCVFLESMIFTDFTVF